MTMNYETLLTQLDGGVMTVTLNRPDKLNAEAWELPGEGVALAWGGLEQEELGVSLSIPLQKGLDAQFDYSDAQALVRGHVLFFDGEGVLVATGEGLLDDLRKASERRPSSVE